MNAWDAARDGNYDFVQYLIRREPATLRAKDDNDVTPLCYAVIGNRPHIVRLLVEAGVDPNVTCKTSLPITFAAMSGYLEIVKYLLSQNCELYSINKHSISPIHASIISGNGEIVRAFLEHDSRLIDYVTPKLGTPLHSACDSENATEAIKVLLAFGSDPNLLVGKDDEKRSPLHVAATKGFASYVELLCTKTPVSLYKGVTHTIPAQVDKLDGNKVTALGHAAVNGHTEVCRLLIKFGANVNALHTPEKLSTLSMALQQNNLELVTTLLDAGADLHYTSPAGTTAMHFAASVENSEEIMRFLRSRGLSVDAADKDGNTPAHLSLLEGLKPNFDVLMDLGADPDAKNAKGNNPFEEYRDAAAEQARIQKEEAERRTCHACKQRETEEQKGTYKRCARCKAVHYCSAACQRSDWKTHKTTCEAPAADAVAAAP